MQWIPSMNVYRVIADSSRVLAPLIILFMLFKTKSCAGISGKSQIAFALVCTTRYLDVFTVFFSVYLTVDKIFFIISAYTAIYLIYVQYKSRENREEDTFPLEYLILPCIAIALRHNDEFTFEGIAWSFSMYLEAVAILPQLFILQDRNKIDKTMVAYLVTISAFRGFYILNWWKQGRFDPITFTPALVETIIYAVFWLRRWIKSCWVKIHASDLPQHSISSKQGHCNLVINPLSVDSLTSGFAKPNNLA